MTEHVTPRIMANLMATWDARTERANFVNTTRARPATKSDIIAHYDVACDFRVLATEIHLERARRHRRTTGPKLPVGTRPTDGPNDQPALCR